jgi:peptide/nickel transport system permease protein
VRRALVRRLFEALLVVFVAASATFVLAHLAPGDPFTTSTESSKLQPEQRAQLRANWGLDRPLPEQYVRWLSAIARGDLGPSLSQHRPVAEAIGEALPATLLLSTTGIVLAFALGIGLGAWQASHRGHPLERASSTLTLTIAAFPDFWLALVAMLTFAYWLPIFPVSGMVDAGSYDYWPAWRQLLDRLHHLVLPACVIAILAAAGIARFQRAALLDALGEEWTRTARAKGVAERAIVLRHALRNALSPTLALLGLSLPALAGGTLFVERVFQWHGMGLLALQAIAARDYFLIMGCVVVGSALVAAGSFVADLLAVLADPRLRDAGARE